MTYHKTTSKFASQDSPIKMEQLSSQFLSKPQRTFLKGTGYNFEETTTAYTPPCQFIKEHEAYPPRPSKIISLEGDSAVISPINNVPAQSRQHPAAEVLFFCGKDLPKSIAIASRYLVDVCLSGKPCSIKPEST